MTYPKTIPIINNNSNININNNCNRTEHLISNAGNVSSAVCLSDEQMQLCQPLNAANTLKSLSLLAPQPQSTLMLIDGTQQYVVSSDAVNISSLSSPASSPYSTNSPMFFASINTPQPEQKQQDQQLATQLFDICYGKSVPAFPQALSVNST